MIKYIQTGIIMGEQHQQIVQQTAICNATCQVSSVMLEETIPILNRPCL